MRRACFADDLRTTAGLPRPGAARNPLPGCAMNRRMARSGAAQVVGDGKTESLQFLVGRFELGGAQRHALLEFGVEGADFLFGPFVPGDILVGPQQIRGCCHPESRSADVYSVRNQILPPSGVDCGSS